MRGRTGDAPGGYRAALTAPGAPPLVAWSLLGRLAYAMTNLSVLFYVQAVTGSYAIAGAMSAASLLGTATGSVVQGRLIDRFGPSRPLLALVPPYALLSTAVILAIPARIPLPLLAVAIVAQHVAQPILATASRMMWPRLVPAGPVRDAAYSYEAISFEACWLTAPVAAGTLATLLWPGTALVVAATGSAVAAIGFALVPAARTHRGDPARRRPARPTRITAGASGPALGAKRRPDPAMLLRNRGLHTLLLAALGFGTGIGFVVVGVIATAAAGGAARLTGLFFVLWSTSSVLGGLAYNRRPWPSRLPARLLALMCTFGGLVAIPGLAAGAASSALAVLAVLAGTMALTGLTLAPQVTAHNTILDHLVPQRKLSEAYGWITTVVAVGNAAGQSAGGVLVQWNGHGAPFLGAAGCVAVLTGVVWIRRRSLEPRPDAPREDAPRPEAPHPDAPRPEAPRPDAPRPDAPTSARTPPS